MLWGGDPIPEQQTQPFLAAGGWSRPVLSLLWVTGLPWCPSGASTQKLQLENETPALLTRGHNVAESWEQLPFSPVNTNKLPLTNGIGCRWCFVQ